METGTAAKMKLTNKKVKNSQVKWTSSNKKVAKVYKNGIVKVVGNGSATISAKSKKLTRCGKAARLLFAENFTGKQLLNDHI